MASKKPKPFLLSSFLRFLRIKPLFFIHFNNFLSFYLFFIFILEFYTPNCEATTLYRYKFNHYHSPEGKIILHRVPRSPFLPPTVTSFKPSIRKSLIERSKHHEKVTESKVLVVPPIVASQSKISLSSTKISVKKFPNIPQPELISPVRVQYPRPPMVIPYVKKDEPKFNNTKIEFIVTPQNDQHSLSPKEVKKENIPQKNVINQTEMNSKTESKNLKEKPQESNGGNLAKGLAGLDEVLDGLDITLDDLHQVLKRIDISMENFLDFIDREKTKDEIMAYLKLPESLKYTKRKNGYTSNVYKTTKSIPYSISGNYQHKYTRVDRQKELVDHLPITEIVHEVPMNSQATYKDPVQYSSKNEKFHAKKNYGKPSDNEFAEKQYKTKRYKPNSENNPYMMNSDISTMFPPKDSPIIISFMPPNRKPTKPTERTKGSASIVSMTIEEKITADSSKFLHETTLPIRNKVLHTDAEVPTNFPKTEKDWNKRSYEQQQANLRHVFPVRGIIMFCAILGLVAILTILMLIIYGTMKCNQKPTSSTYELSEHQDGSTSSVITST